MVAGALEGARFLEIYDFDVMLTVAELGSFRKAALQLSIGQSAVSRRIQKIENALGVSLFERHVGGARLTAAGWRFCRCISTLALNFDEAAHQASLAGTAKQGCFNLGLIASLSRGVFREVTVSFVAQLPDVDLRLVEAERGQLLTLLSHRRLDAVFASGAFPAEHGDSFVVAREQTYIALPEDHCLASRGHLEWDDVRSEHFIVSASEPGPEIRDYLIQRLADLGRQPRISRQCVGREGIMNLVGLGLGLALVAEHWCGVAYPGVVFRPVGNENERVEFSLVWRPENDNPALRRFVSLARVEARKASVFPSAASRNPDPSP